MSRTRRYDDDEAYEIVNGKKCLRDRIRVPMVAMDHVQRSVAANFDWRTVAENDDNNPLVTDGLGNSGAALCRPGYRVMTGDAFRDAQAEAAAARQEYLTSLTSAWEGDKRKPKDEDHDEDEDDIPTRAYPFDADKDHRRRKSQFRDPEGREAGTEEESFEDRLRKQQQERARATDAAYADYARTLEATHRGGK